MSPIKGIVNENHNKDKEQKDKEITTRVLDTVAHQYLQYFPRSYGTCSHSVELLKLKWNVPLLVEKKTVYEQPLNKWIKVSVNCL